MPLSEGDVEATHTVDNINWPYNRKEKERCGVQIYVRNHDDEMGDHEPFGNCMLWFSEMDTLPSKFSENPTKLKKTCKLDVQNMKLNLNRAINGDQNQNRL